MKNRPAVCSYYFPNWHVDPHNEQLHGTNWTEWEVVKCARSRFPWHEQPKVPLWGYEDESSPAVMAKKIAAAAEYGIDAFIFDYYYYDFGPYRDRCLQDGFLKAENRKDIKFALMWANHAAAYAHPGSYLYPCRRDFWNGEVSPETFRRCTDHIIENYFVQDNYLRVDGGLYFSIYLLHDLINDLGGVEKTGEAFRDFRERVAKAGLGKLYLDISFNYSFEDPTDFDRINALLEKLGVDSCSNYGNVRPATFPDFDYAEMMQINMKELRRISNGLKVPYHPVAMTGYDSSPRTVQSDMYENRGYPFITIARNNGPERWKEYLKEFAEFIDTPEYTGKLMHLACWNEWTEGCYLEPDEKDGFARLEAVREVFGKK